MALPTNFDPNNNIFLESNGSKIDIEDVSWDNLDSNQQAIWRKRAIEAGIIKDDGTFLSEDQIKAQNDNNFLKIRIV